MTGSLTVAVVGAPDVAGELGKKGTQSDVSLYNDVHEANATTFVEPTQFPEKIAPLFVALAMADRTLLVVRELTRPVAETIAAVELALMPTHIAVGPAVGEVELARALRGSRLVDTDRSPLDLPSLRERIAAWNAPERPGPVAVPLDHAFPVKGVGTVALGVVRRGTLRAHERLRLWPAAKAVEVRSIQVHDQDRKEAQSGERVGVALRDVDPDEVPRGSILAPEGTLASGRSLAGAPLVRCPYYRGDAREGAQLHAAVGLQVVPVSVDRFSPTGVAFTADRDVVYASGTPAFLLDLSVPTGPRIVGRTDLTASASG